MSEETNDVRERLQEVARTIAVMLPPHTGFALLCFDLVDQSRPDRGPGRLEYLSNGRREDVVTAMKEFIEKTERSWGKHV